MTLHTRCLAWATAGGALGASIAAYAQEPVQAGTTVAADPTAALLVELARVSPLAAVLGSIAFAIARMGPPTVRVVLVPEGPSMEERLRELEAKLARD